MPIHPSIATTRIAQADFKRLASEVMHHVFEIHNEFGRLFSEPIYKRELAARMPGVILEAAVTVTHDTFAKTYFLDVLARNSGLFEFKAADSLHPRHRGQTLNYLLLFDLAHGKIVNVRSEGVQHEFINCHNRLSALRNPKVVDTAWKPRFGGADSFRNTLMSLISDWGVGLELALYEEALIHLLGGEQAVIRPVPVFGRDGFVATQRMNLAAPEVAFRLTALHDDGDIPSRLEAFEAQVRKFLMHTRLQAIHWANLTHREITFTTLQRR
jgi:GxxExxY protein